MFRVLKYAFIYSFERQRVVRDPRSLPAPLGSPCAGFHAVLREGEVLEALRLGRTWKKLVFQK